MSCIHFEKSNCAECDERKTVVAEEHKKKYILQNPEEQRVCKIKVDGCFNNDETAKKCDFLVLDCKGSQAFFVELKGAKLMRAIEQIDESISRKLHLLPGFKINARIVLSKDKTPNLKNNPKYIRFAKRLRDLGGTLKKGTRIIEESL